DDIEVNTPPDRTHREGLARDRGGPAPAEPSAVPPLNTPPARARSCIGNHSDTAFTPAGKFAGSVAPSRNRHNPSCNPVLARPWSMLATDQPEANIVYPRRVPSTSTSLPLTAYITA